MPRAGTNDTRKIPHTMLVVASCECRSGVASLPLQRIHESLDRFLSYFGVSVLLTVVVRLACIEPEHIGRPTGPKRYGLMATTFADATVG